MLFMSHIINRWRMIVHIVSLIGSNVWLILAMQPANVTPAKITAKSDAQATTYLYNHKKIRHFLLANAHMMHTQNDLF